MRVACSHAHRGLLVIFQHSSHILLETIYVRLLHCLHWHATLFRSTSKCTLPPSLSPSIRYLMVNPKDHRVVVVESLLCPHNFRNTLAKVLFNHFNVSMLCEDTCLCTPVPRTTIPVLLCKVSLVWYCHPMSCNLQRTEVKCSTIE